MTTEKIICRVSNYLKETGNNEVVDVLESILSEVIEKSVRKDSFFSLPTDHVLKIIKNSQEEDVSTIKNIVGRMSSFKGEEAPLVLNIINANNANFEDCIDIISNLDCPICKKLKELYTPVKQDINNNKNEKERITNELKKLKEEIAAKENSLNELKYLKGEITNPLVDAYLKNDINNFTNSSKSMNYLNVPYYTKHLPFELCKSDNNLPYLKVLVESGKININMQEHVIKKTLLQIAVEHDCLNTVILLMKNGASPCIDCNGTTTLHYIGSKKDKLKLLKYITYYYDSYKHSINIKNSNGLTAVEVAENAKNTSAAALIKNGGWNWNIRKGNETKQVFVKPQETSESLFERVRKMFPPKKGDRVEYMTLHYWRRVLHKNEKISDYELGEGSEVCLTYGIVAFA